MEEHGGNSKNLYAFCLSFRFLSSPLFFFLSLSGWRKKKTAGDVADAPNVPTALPSFRLLKMARKINSRMKSVFYPPPSLPPSLRLLTLPSSSSSFPITSKTVFGSHLDDWNQRATPTLPRLQLLPNCHFDLKQTTRRTARLFYLFFGGTVPKKLNQQRRCFPACDPEGGRTQSGSIQRPMRRRRLRNGVTSNGLLSFKSLSICLFIVRRTQTTSH